MSNSSTYSILYKIEGDTGSLKKLSVDAVGFKKIIQSTVVEAEKLKGSMVNLAAISTTLDSLSKTIGDIRDKAKDLAAAHAAQIQVETQLAVNMRNSMQATEQEIQSIKDLCSAQQELGIVGDEVQLAGAQKIALFLKEKQSLDSLIPAMNDLAAAQFGFNVTQENAAQIATAMGNAITGQTAELKRYGLMLTDAQEQVMKYGTEAQRVAVLCEVVSGSVGGMNEALAKTPDGKVKQLENYFGDLKETVGGIAQFMMPFLEWATNATIATLGVIKLCAAIKALVVVIKQAHVAQKAVAVGTFVATGNMNKATQAANIYSRVAAGSAASATALKVALRGLLITSVVGIALTALVAIIYKLVSASDDATESLGQFDDTTEMYTRTAADAKTQIEQDIKTLGELIKSNDDTTDAVRRLNRTYGETFGNRSTASEWYDTLISKSEDYIKCIGYEAQALALRDELYKALIEEDAANERVQELEQTGKTKKTKFHYTTPGTVLTSEEDTKEYADAKKVQAQAHAHTEAIRQAAEKTAAKANQLRSQLKAGAADTHSALQVNEMDWEQVTEAIEETEKSLKKTLDPAKIEQLKAYNEQLKARKEFLEDTLGLSNSGGRRNDLTDPGDMYIFTSIDQFTQKRKYLQQLSEKADFDQKARYDEQIAQLDELQKRLETQAKWKRDGVTVERFHSDTPTIKTTSMSAPPETVSRRLGGVDPTATSLPDITENIKALNEQLDNNRNIGMYEAGLINEQIAMWEKKAEAIRNAGKAAEDTTSVITNAVGSMGSSLSSLGDSLELPALNVAGTMAQAVATLALSFAKMMDKTAPMGPFGWLAFGATGLAQLVAMVSTVKSLPAFANGGIISGPTIGLMGEYPGAANNPEVVAPLNTLTDLIQPAAAPVGGKVVFEISGRNLRGVLQKEERFIQRT